MRFAFELTFKGAGKVGTLVKVTEHAGPGQVFQIICASVLARDDMFDVEIPRLHGKIGQAAILTSPARPLPDRVTIGARHVGLARFK